MIIFIRALFLSLCLLVTAASSAFAAVDVSVTVEPDSGTVEDEFTLSVTVTGDFSGNVSPPQFDGSDQFRISTAGTSSNMSWINGAQSRSLVFQFRVTPDATLPPGEYPLPSGRMTIAGQDVTLKRPTITIGASAKHEEATAGKGKGEGIDFVQIVSNLEPYVGEQVFYRVEIASSGALAEAELDDLDLHGAWRESFGKAKETMRSIANSTTKVYSVREALFPNAAGELRIPARSLVARIRVPARHPSPSGFGGWSVFDEFWPSALDYDTVQKRFRAEPLVLKVKPLPPPPEKVDQVLVGETKLKFSIDKEVLKEGDSATVKVELTSDANLRPYEIPFGKDSADLRFYPDKPVLETTLEGDRIRFKKLFTIAVVPSHPGEIDLPVARVMTFEPKLGRYVVVESPKRKLSVFPDPKAKPLNVVAPPAVQGTDQKEVTQLGEDLLPQHVGPELYSSRRGVPRTRLFAVLFLCPVLAALLFVYKGREEFHRLNPEVAARRKAVVKARSALSAEALSADSIAQILRTYLGEKFRRKGEALTAVEAGELLRQHRVGNETAAKIQDALKRLERLSYGGGTTAATSGLQGEVGKLIEEVERSV